MSKVNTSLLNIGVVGGSSFSRNVLEKLTMDYNENEVNARIVALADNDPYSPAMVFGKYIGLKTVTDYHKLFDPGFDIDLLMILSPEQEILEDVLKTKPAHIRVLAYQVFEIIWKSIGVEERKLRDRTAEMEAILNGIQDFILLITPDRKILEVNDAFLDHMGYNHQEVIGKECYKVFQQLEKPCDDEDLACPLSDVIRNHGPVQRTLSRKSKDGETNYFEITIFPIWEKDGKISKFIEISRNVTDRKKQEEELTRNLEAMVEERSRKLEETHAKLIHQDKMASLGKLSASVVHEINNPIAGTLNLLMLIQRITEEDNLTEKELTRFKEYLSLMETETRRISRIVSNLLAFSRQSKMELKSVDLNKIIEKILFLNSNLLKINRVRVNTSLQPDLPSLIGSDDQLQQAFMNFVSNASEAMEANENGILKISTGHSLKDGKVFVQFEDNGIGIPKENIPKLFEPFFTTKKKGKGVGLGLSVAYGIIQEHGGSINVESEKGRGTMLMVNLPLREPESIH